MKPLRIEIQNFGAIPFAEVDLRNTSIAAICGPNGAGKSTAFTIAPMFALFGTTKTGTSTDDMVRTGSTESAVTFEFEHQGSVWRVIRTRSTKGRGKSTLELQRQSGELWSSESGASITETQKRIIDLLNLDADTFAASSMILQGDAGNFTKRAAGQRKAILAQILQLDQYETLQEKAREKVSEMNIQLERIKTQVSSINDRLAGRDALEGEKLSLEMQKITIIRKIQQTEKAVQDAQIDLAGLTVKINQADELRKQAGSLREDLTKKTSERDQHQQRIAVAEKILSQEQLIRAAVSESDVLRDEITALNVKKSQQTSILEEANRLKTELTQVEASLQKLLSDIDPIQKTLADRSGILSSKEQYDLAVQSLEQIEKKRVDYEATNQQLLKAETDWNTSKIKLETEADSRQKEIDSLQKRAAMLLDAKCIDIERATCAFLADAKDAEKRVKRLQGEKEAWYQTTAAAVEVLRVKVFGMREILTSIGYDPTAYTELQQKIAALRPHAEAAGKLEGMEQLLTNYLDQQKDLTARQADIQHRLSDMRAQFKELSDELKDLPEKQKRFNELQELVALKDKIPAARESLENATTQVELLILEMDSITKKITNLEQEHTALIGNAAELHREAQENIKTLQEALSTSRALQSDVVAKLGGIQAKLDALGEDANHLETLQLQMEPMAKKLSRWQTLVKAFGRDGIQALILENAVPELERIANDILGQMSGGKNYLRFETQKELKSRSGMAETLDIIVGDWAGERIYETYSGGEQLRIDFAIRFALAELLARRAGAKVDWLTIDEGFGSQSDEFLPSVIEAVKSVSNRFGVVLVISHVKAVQEAFEQKIYFKPQNQDEAVEVLVA